MTEYSSQSPVVSVLVVSDYDDSQQKSWNDERLVLTALACQDFGEPFEVVLVENESFRDEVPPGIHDILPNLRIVFSPATRSAELKDYGVGVASGELVAVLEADCIPNSRWLHLLDEVLRTHPRVSAVSSKTTYGSSNVFERVLSLLDRGPTDLGRSGSTRVLSNNGALYRRALLERYRYPDAVSPFVSAGLRLQSMQRDGYEFFFEPRAVVVHAFKGWRFVSDYRRHKGYQKMIAVPGMPYFSIPKLFLRNFRQELSLCKRLGLDYLRWYDWPVTLVLLVLLPILEIPGMIDAAQGRERIPNTGYR